MFLKRRIIILKKINILNQSLKIFMGILYKTSIRLNIKNSQRNKAKRVIMS